MGNCNLQTLDTSRKCCKLFCIRISAKSIIVYVNLDQRKAQALKTITIYTVFIYKQYFFYNLGMKNAFYYQTFSNPKQYDISQVGCTTKKAVCLEAENSCIL